MIGTTGYGFAMNNRGGGEFVAVIDFGGGALGSLGKIASSPTREARRVCRRVESLRPIIGGMLDCPGFSMQGM